MALLARQRGHEVVAGLPVALVPLWQLAHDPVTAAWSNVAGTQASVEWQSAHCALVAMWAAGLPVADVPLWQDVHVPLTALWSTRTFVHAVLTWQSSHVLVEAICVGGLPVACVPL